MKKVLIVIAAVLVVLFLAKDFIASSILTFGIGSFTDLSASVQKLSLGLFSGKVDVKGFKLYNPKVGFKDRVMVDMPELYLDCDLGSFMSGVKHMRKVKLDLAEFVVVKNEGGQLNLDSLKAIQAKMGQGKGGKKEETKFKIDVLELKIDKVVYKDYSLPGGPMTKEFKVGINERYENITDPYSLASMIVYKALVNTSIASLANFDVGSLKSAASDTLATATKVAADTVEKALGTVSKSGEAVKKLLPFGNK